MIIPRAPYPGQNEVYGITRCARVYSKSAPRLINVESPAPNYDYPATRRSALIMFQEAVKNFRPCRVVWYDDADGNKPKSIALYPGPV